MTSRWTRVRIVVCGLALAGFATWVGRAAVDLQVKKADWLSDLAEENYLREVQIPPRRGRILDRNGKELATTIEVDSVFCNPRVLRGVPGVASKLAKALKMDVREVQQKLASQRYFVWLKRQVEASESAAAMALGLPSVATRKEPKRFYPLRTLAATVIGHAGRDGRGLEGVEKAFDPQLRGQPTVVQGIKDALGRDLFIDGVADTSALAGKDVVLTIDAYLQKVTEDVLGATADKYSAISASSVMIDPRTGEVLAMASVPTYNPNDPKKALEIGARNRAITDTYEPGSTQKTFTFAAALDAGKLRPTDLFDCQMGRMQIGKYTIRDTHGLGTITAAEVFQHSSNIGTTKIARRIGREALADALARFNLGRKTGIELEGEQRGIVRPIERWGEIGFANVAFGQGLTVTPLQMTAGYASVASGGVYHPPRIGLRIVGPDGKGEPIPGAADRSDRRVVSERASRTLLEIMRKVTEEKGTAKAAAIPGYPVAGKTGTAQKVANGHYAPGKYIASFIGVVPANDPRLVIAVVVDEPKPVHLGGQVAAPAFREIAEAALKYLSVPASEPIVAKDDKAGDKAKPEQEGEDAAGSDAVLGEDEGDAVPAGADEDELDGDDAAARAQAELAAKGYVPVPDFSGMSVGEAIRTARAAGVEVAPDGSGVCVAQSPPLRAVPRGFTLRLAFKPPGG
jgi:cell division protein FtsI (penicillin-binding protein 3)